MSFTDLSFDSALSDRVLQQKAGDTRPIFVEENGDVILPDAFDQKVEQTAAWLVSIGIGAGDRVAVWLPNKLDWMLLLFGCARIGAIVVAVNTRYRTSELQHIMTSSGAKLLVFDTATHHSNYHDMIVELNFETLTGLKRLATLSTTVSDLAPINDIPIEKFDRNHLPDHAVVRTGKADDPVALFTTSGTTNLPKLVVHQQKTLAWHANQCVDAYHFCGEQTGYLAVMPFCGVFGLTPTLASIAGGVPIYLNEVFSLEQVLKTAKNNVITHLFGSDDMFIQMWAADQTAFQNARVCGFASFTPGCEEALSEIAANGVPLAGLYGASELSALYSIQSLDLPIEERLRGGGSPAAGQAASIRVRNPETGILCAKNEVGILEFKTPSNFIGYYQNEAATRKAIDEEGFFISGDAGYIREDGSFVYLARNGDFLRLSGFLTDPKEIEEVIEGCLEIKKCQVVGITLNGKTRTVAFVVTEGDDFDETDVLEQAKSHLAHYKVPIRIIKLDAFPTTESANGVKIQKAKLREQAEAICLQPESIS